MVKIEDLSGILSDALISRRFEDAVNVLDKNRGQIMRWANSGRAESAEAALAFHVAALSDLGYPRSDLAERLVQKVIGLPSKEPRLLDYCYMKAAEGIVCMDTKRENAMQSFKTVLEAAKLVALSQTKDVQIFCNSAVRGKSRHRTVSLDRSMSYGLFCPGTI